MVGGTVKYPKLWESVVIDERIRVEKSGGWMDFTSVRLRYEDLPAEKDREAAEALEEQIERQPVRAVPQTFRRLTLRRDGEKA